MNRIERFNFGYADDGFGGRHLGSIPKADGRFVRFDDHKDAVDQLRAENEALRKDAERYRWLRDQDRDGRLRGEPFIAIQSHAISHWTHEPADRKIDSAMGKDQYNG